MAEIKTRPTEVSVDDFIAAVEKPVRRADARIVRDMMERVTGEPATMWGPTIIGFGTYHWLWRRFGAGHQGAPMSRASNRSILPRPYI